LDDHRFRLYAFERSLPEVWAIGHHVAAPTDPLEVVEELLDL